MKMVRAIVFGFLLTVPVASFAYFESPKTNIQDPEMNGIKLSQFPDDLVQSWKLVTTRFRVDTGEMRFTYANEKAWKTLQGLETDYPDGAIFAKIGRASEKDPIFTSSLVPSGAKRFQFMVRDKKKFKSTAGWGYALFDQSGQLYSGDVKANTAACAACHNIAAERGFVFSRPMDLSFHTPLPREGAKPAARIPTISKKVTSLPKQLREKLADSSNQATIDVVTGQLAESGFSGTLDEVIPLLLESAASSHRTTALILNGQNFSAVLPMAETCESRKSKYQIFVLFNGSPVRATEICQ